MLGMTARTEICEPVKALIAEGEQVLEAWASRSETRCPDALAAHRPLPDWRIARP